MVSVEPPDWMRPLVTSWTGGARERQRVDAGMRAEAFVLVGEQHGEKTRIDVGDPRRQPPAAFARRVSAQQAAVAIKDARREGDIVAERRRTERGDPPAGATDCRKANERAGGKGEPRPFRHTHFAAVTSTLSVAVRP